MTRKIRQTFNDGICYIYAVADTAESGHMPIPTPAEDPKATIGFAMRTVGVARFYAAMQNNRRVDLVVRCPLRPNVGVADIARLNGVSAEIYEIIQIQRPQDVTPPCMDLSLERVQQHG